MNSNRTLLPDPGFVHNSKTFGHCYQACLLMCLRAMRHEAIPSLQKLDSAINDVAGKYSWPFDGLVYLASCGYETVFWSSLDLELLTTNPERAILEHYGEEKGADQIENSDLSAVSLAAQRYLNLATNEHRTFVPGFSAIRDLLDDGFYVIPEVNQRNLQGDEGYVGHYLFIFGYDEQSVRMHNPGPPPQVSSEVSWYSLDRAWSVPKKASRILIAARPPRQEPFFDYLKDHD